MKGLYLVAPVLLYLGCGPMQMPMAPRLDKDGQAKMDEAWDRALAPVERLEHQRWLDIFVGVQAYQAGVDRLTFRSEKTFSGGTVVMEIAYDRAHPEADHFHMTVFDHAGKRIRHESYSREEVERTYGEMFVNTPAKNQGEPLSQERAAFEARWKNVEEFFPRDDKKDDEKKAGQ